MNALYPSPQALFLKETAAWTVALKEAKHSMDLTKFLSIAVSHQDSTGKLQALLLVHKTIDY